MATMSNNYRDFAFKTISDLVADGIKFAKSDQSAASVQNWLDYSQKVVELSTKDLDASILLNYLQLLLSIQRNNMPVNKRIITCLEYLLEVLRIITKQ